MKFVEITTGYSRIHSILDFLHKSPNRTQLIYFLSENVCPFGEVSGAVSYFTDDSGNLTRDTFAGFKSDDYFRKGEIVEENHPGKTALQNLKILYQDMKTIKKGYPQYNKMKYSSDYLTGVAIPVTMNRAYGFAFTSDITEILDYKEYFESIRSILSLWENHSSNGGNSVSDRNNLSHALSSRQKNILKLIVGGQTNLYIGNELGYSESLIRQETILIYKKLGIHGRRDLLNVVSEEE